MRTTTQIRAESPSRGRARAVQTLVAITASAVLFAACSDAPTAPLSLNAAHARPPATASATATALSGHHSRGYQPPDPCGKLASCATSATVDAAGGTCPSCTTASARSGVELRGYEPPDPCRSACKTTNTTALSETIASPVR